MTLTVRLPQPLESALENYCAAHGLTKSEVVQECLAEYLVREKRQAQDSPAEVSANYAALKRAGLIGCVSGAGGASATKEVVRQRALERLTRAR
jgi:hypothetical protein